MSIWETIEPDDLHVEGDMLSVYIGDDFESRYVEIPIKYIKKLLEVEYKNYQKYKDALEKIEGGSEYLLQIDPVKVAREALKNDTSN